MRKLIYIVIALFALFTLINAYTDVKEKSNNSFVSDTKLYNEKIYLP